MSQRKSIRDSAKKQLLSKSSSTKPKILFPAKVQKEIPTVSKNLMRQFNEAESHHTRQQKYLKSEHSIKETDRRSQLLQEESSLQSQDSRFDNYEAYDPATSYKHAEMIEYAELQLPKSYILAMRGLQQAIQQREKETRKVKKLLSEQTSLCEKKSQQLKNEIEAKNKLQIKLSQNIQQNKFYRQTIMETKSNASEQLRIKIDIEKQLKVAQASITQQKAYAEELKKEIEQLTRQKQAIKQQLHQANKNIDQKKNDYNQLLLKRSEQFSHNYAEVLSLRQQLAKLKEQHQKDVSEICILKEEIAILSDKLVLQEARFKEKTLLDEKMQLDRLQRELQANRHILQEVTFDQNCMRQAFENSAHNCNSAPRNLSSSNQTELKQSAPTPTPIKQLKQPQQSRALERSLRQERPSTLRQQRSVSRLRQTNDAEHPQRRELVGQMRELMRHQKELISLNYQMEVIEKGMLEGAPNKREEAQRTYAKLRRNIQKKEADVRQLKYLIDKATTHAAK